jgi:protease I
MEVTMGKLDGKRVAFLATNGVQHDELQRPWQAARDEGARIELVSIRTGEIRSERGGQEAGRFTVDRPVSDASAADYDGLVIPGGVKNPDTLRMDADAVRFVADFFAQDKPVASICHGPWMLVEADVVRGRTLTSYPSLKTDIRNAGGKWVDEEVHVDRGLVTSRQPDDLDAFCAKMVEEVAEGRHTRGPVGAAQGST